MTFDMKDRVCSCMWGRGCPWHPGYSLQVTATHSQGLADFLDPPEEDPGQDPTPGAAEEVGDWCKEVRYWHKEVQDQAEQGFQAKLLALEHGQLQVFSNFLF
ncbi:hypothetical protein Y1Q_0017962 [Alligator mississippiensis]|uniref:Uncharacterized protein n=1 Tax=Alligator mississippiensis TaxID=8496 RepID=A0A151MXZ1_ALLMI|nr:hypothetical protein Y1Q_0017962 [Alligator mississippiensis]